MKAGVLDANVVLRFFLQDHPVQSPAVTTYLKRAKDQKIELLLLDAIVAEVTFVMEKVYRRRRSQIADALLDFIQNPFITTQGAALLSDALVRYRTYPIDFPDALVAAQAAANDIDAVSFDKDMDHFPDVTRYEPKA